MPEEVARELADYGLSVETLNRGAKVVIHHFELEKILRIFQQVKQPTIHFTDAAVFLLAEQVNFSWPVLTDDLALRRQLEARGTAGPLHLSLDYQVFWFASLPAGGIEGGEMMVTP